MKKLIMVLMVFVAFMVFAIPQAWAGSYEVDLDTGSGVTTEASGTSPFRLNFTDDLWAVDKVYELEGDFTFQVSDIDLGSGVTSGATYQITYKESLIDDDAHWAAATATTIVGPVAIESGTTPQQVPFYPDMTNYLRFYVTTGAGVFSKFEAKVRCK